MKHRDGGIAVAPVGTEDASEKGKRESEEQAM